MDSFPEGVEFEVISDSKFFCKLCKSTIKIPGTSYFIKTRANIDSNC
jgi:hypothetical protein